MAAANVDHRDDSVTNARLELEMLQAMNKTRVELHPQFSVFSFSNPMLLAMTLGGSLSINRRTAPSPVNLALARIAVVEAEIRHANTRINAEIESARQFFALAEAREFESVSCGMWRDESRGRDQLQRLVSLRRRTTLDVVRFDQQLAGLESECVEARAQAQTAALALVRQLGSERPAEHVDVVSDDLTGESAASGLPRTDELVRKAFESRADLSSLSNHISRLAEPRAKTRPQLDSLSAGYGYLKNSADDSLSRDFLLGGNVAHVDGGFYLPLRKTGVDAATAAFLQARFSGLQRDLEDLKVSLRRAVETNLQRSALAEARLRVARKKESLARELQQLTSVREGRGLQTESDDFWTRRDASRATAEAKRAELEWKQSVFTVLAICDPATIISGKKARPDPFGAEVNRVTSLLRDSSNQTSPELLAWNGQNSGMPSATGLPSEERRESLLKLSQLLPSRNSARVDIAPPVIDPAGIRQVGIQWEPGAFSPPPPIAAATLSAAINRTTVQPQPTKPAYAPPKVLRRKNIERQGIAAWRLWQDTLISVDVTIDQYGRVAQAVALNDGIPVRSLALTGQAVAAAREWIFEPARMGDKPVSSHHTIVFEFRGQSSGPK
jgi:hypothetical protein